MHVSKYKERFKLGWISIIIGWDKLLCLLKINKVTSWKMFLINETHNIKWQNALVLFIMPLKCHSTSHKMRCYRGCLLISTLSFYHRKSLLGPMVRQSLGTLCGHRLHHRFQQQCMAHCIVHQPFSEKRDSKHISVLIIAIDHFETLFSLHMYY